MTAMRPIGRRSLRGKQGARRAVIDIGSNTVRLVVYDGPLRAPRTLWNEKVAARLGRDLATTGRIPDEASEQALAALARFALLAEELDVHDVQTVATAASRDAENGAEFLERVRELGLEPRLLGCCNQIGWPRRVDLLAPEADLCEAMGWGLAMRLARRLGATTRVSLTTSALERSDNTLVLHLAKSRAALAGEGTVRDLAALAGWLELTPELRIGG